jgi:hypothetical protein
MLTSPVFIKLLTIPGNCEACKGWAVKPMIAETKDGVKYYRPALRYLRDNRESQIFNAWP